MLKHTKFWTGAALAVAMALPVWAEDVTVDTVLATVNGTDITLGNLIVARRALPEQYQSLPDEVLFEGLLQQLIQQVVLAQSLGDEEPKAVRLSIENESQAIRANEVVTRTVAEAVTEDALQTAYDERYGDAQPAPEFNASHILVESEDEAKSLVEALDGGADFAELAREKSTGPSGPNGGELGWFGLGAMVPAFEEAVVALEVGAISSPVQTQFGWHVVKLNDSRDAPVPTLEEVQQELAASVQQSAVEALITSLTEAAEITQAEPGTIDPSALSNPEILPN